MHKMVRRLVAAMAGLALLTAGALVAGAESTRDVTLFFRNIGLSVGSERVPSEHEPFILDGNTYVPVRVVAEALGAGVEWDGQRNWVLINTGKGAVPVSELALTGNDEHVKTGAVTAHWTRTRYLHARSINFMYGRSGGCASPCPIELALNGQYTRFQGITGIADHDSVITASGRIRVYIDDHLVDDFRVYPTNPPRSVAYDVRGALAIRFEYSNFDRPVILAHFPMFLTGAASP